jgi:hypothetical protein
MVRTRRPPSRKILRERVHPLLAHELYIYEAVSKGAARVFYQEFEQRKKAAFKAATGDHVEFRFHDVVFFLVVAAANGVAGNLAYSALTRAVSAVRKPKLEGGGVTLSAVVKRQAYNRERLKKHAGAKGLSSSAKIQQELVKQYELIV